MRTASGRADATPTITNTAVLVVNFILKGRLDNDRRFDVDDTQHTQ